MTLVIVLFLFFSIEELTFDFEEYKVYYFFQQISW